MDADLWINLAKAAMAVTGTCLIVWAAGAFIERGPRRR